MRALSWLLRAFVFFALFAFALNNQQSVGVNGFFGITWQAPLVIVVLVAFAAGCAFGVVAMVPSWWRQRRGAARQPADAAPTEAPPRAPAEPASDFGPDHPPREGL